MLKPRIRANLICWRCKQPTKITQDQHLFIIKCLACNLLLVATTSYMDTLYHYKKAYESCASWWELVPKTDWDYYQ